MNPTIGRTVIYKTTEADRKILRDASGNESQELPAVVVAVWSDDCVNAQVITDSEIGLMRKTSIVKGDGEGEWNWPVIQK